MPFIWIPRDLQDAVYYKQWREYAKFQTTWSQDLWGGFFAGFLVLMGDEIRTDHPAGDESYCELADWSLSIWFLMFVAWAKVRCNRRPCRRCVAWRLPPSR